MASRPVAPPPLERELRLAPDLLHASPAAQLLPGIVQWGIIMCVAIVPLALGAGAVRELPLGWQVVNISFDAGAIISLGITLRLIRTLEREPESAAQALPS